MTYYKKEQDFINFPRFNLNELTFICSLFNFSLIINDNSHDFEYLTIKMPYYNSYFSYLKSFFGQTEYVSSSIYYIQYKNHHKLIFFIDIDDYNDKKLQWWKFQVNAIIDSIKYYYKV